MRVERSPRKENNAWVEVEEHDIYTVSFVRAALNTAYSRRWNAIPSCGQEEQVTIFISSFRI